jgi:hypothetical protein
MKKLDQQAFPMSVPTDWEHFQKGMTLRDYFAGQIVNGLLSGKHSFETVRDLANKAYIYADIMLEERGG